MAKYLVTGIAGFIGSTIARALVARGDSVRGLDNLSTGKMENLAELDGRIDFQRGDVSDPQAVRKACAGIDYVFHEAALPSVPKSISDPATSHRSNIEGTFQILLAARESGVKRVLYASSSSVYGDTPTLPKREDMALNPISPYAVQKLCGEQYMVSFCRVYGLETVSLRYFNVFGPGQDPSSPYSSVLSLFCTRMLAGQQPVIYGDGLNTRDFTYVDNVVEANLRAMAAPAERVAGRVFNVATGRKVSLNESFALVKGLTGFPGAAEYAPARVGDIIHSYADSSAAHAAFGYAPHVGFEEGLKRTIEWYRHSDLRSQGKSGGQ